MIPWSVGSITAARLSSAPAISILSRRYAPVAPIEGGSSHVARTLARQLPSHGWDVTIVSGSRSGHGDATRFYAGLDVQAIDLPGDHDTAVAPAMQQAITYFQSVK